MRYNIKGKNLEIGDRTREKVEKKLDRIKKLFPDDTATDVTVASEKFLTTVEVTIYFNKRLLRAECSATELQEALDKAVDILENQVVKYKKRMRTRSRQGGAYKAEYDAISIDESGLDDEPVRKIEKYKKFELRPMDPEEAIMQMELLGHSFFVFMNINTEDINVVYKRKNGSFGLIEPES